MNKDYQVKFTGTIIGGPTLVGHLLGHTLNARNFFGMEHGYFVSRQHGLDEQFPDYVRDVARAVDETFGPAQGRGYYANVPKHEPILFEPDERGKHGPHWPNHDTDFGGFANGFERTDTIDTDEENQIRIWIMQWDWMVRDAAITYLHMMKDVATDPEYADEGARNTRYHEIEYIVWRLYDLHAQFEREQVEHYRKQTSVKQWLLEWLHERGEVTTNLVGASDTVEHNRIHAQLKRDDAKHDGYAHGYGNNLPEAISSLWNEAYRLEEGREKHA